MVRLLPTPAGSDGDRSPDLARANRPDSGGMDLVTTTERLLPTPAASRSGRNRSPSPGAAIRPSLDQIDRLLPTSSDAKASGAAHYSNGTNVTLTDATTRGWIVFADYTPAIQQWEHILGRPAPAPTTDGRLNPRFAEWMMGLPDGHVTDHTTSRAHALRILGNGVVPQQAAAAIRQLADRLEENP